MYVRDAARFFRVRGVQSALITLPAEVTLKHLRHGKLYHTVDASEYSFAGYTAMCGAKLANSGLNAPASQAPAIPGFAHPGL